MVYAVAIAAGAAVWWSAGPSSALWRLALADVVATAVVFAGSVLARNSSVYDPYWSVAPPLLALALGPAGARGVAVTTALALYGVRLTWNWARGWPGLHHEDWRYVDLRRSTGRAYWLVSALGIHLFPTVQVFLGCLPLFFVVRDASPMGALDLLGVALVLGATALEGVADAQLWAHRRDRPGTVCDVGLWARCRHPNYLGEIGVWFGLWVCGVAVGAPLWTAAGWLAILAMFVGVSIPMAERRALARRPETAALRQAVPALWPRLGPLKARDGATRR